jgi:hypothetical protein
MTGAFGAGPVYDFRTGITVFSLAVAELSFPIYLVMFRWCGVGSIAMWCTTLGSLLASVLAGISGLSVAITMLLFIQAIICQSINSASQEATAQHGDK